MRCDAPAGAARPGVRAAGVVRRCAAARLRLPAGPLRRLCPGRGSHGRVVPGRRVRGPQAGRARTFRLLADWRGPAQARRPLAVGRAGAARAAPAGRRAGARRRPVGHDRRPDPGPRGPRPTRRTPPGRAHAALPGRAAGTRSGQAPGPHCARHRGAARAGPHRVPPDLRGRGGLAMTDPFEALREPVTPVDPDPGFARRLRLRLSREVFAPTGPTASTGGTMSQQTVAIGAEREPAWPPALTPYIVVSDARRAMDWYIEVFGAQRRGELYVNADGTIGHAEVGIGDAVLMFAEHSDLWPDVPVRAPDRPALRPRLGDRRPVRAPLDAAATADGS